MTNRRLLTHPPRCLLGIALAFVMAGVTASSAVAPPSDQGDEVVTGGDLSFMNAAAPGGRAEVELGRLAEEKAKNSTVKAFGVMMAADHSKAGKKLEALAEQKHVPLPAKIMPEQQQMMAKLSKLSGSDFDRAYVTAMVTAHQSDVAAFQAVAQNGTDADVKAFAAKTLPTLEKHLELVTALAAKMGLKPGEKE